MLFTGNSGAQHISSLFLRKPTLVFDYSKINPIWEADELTFACSHLFHEDAELCPNTMNGEFVPLAQNGIYQVQQGYRTKSLSRQELTCYFRDAIARFRPELFS